ncbi:MAG: molecular chaperone HtpG [Firmicutes bacterium]|nr:molecular chaperone HtpG [Bacillota bacterium]
MPKKQFKTESKRLLDMMVNSVYTHREIFLRELISNASDAIDKLYFKSLTEHDIDNRFEIRIALDKDNRELSVSDNGIGMSADELGNNLGVIARSGSAEFKQAHEAKGEIDIIGQFGVGFYSAFMVASRITVISRAYGSDEAFLWESEGMDGFSVSPCERDGVGTTVVLKIKQDSDEVNYSEFLDQYRIEEVVKKYSDYIRYPVKMEAERSRLKEGTGDGKKPTEYETFRELETLNSMIPLWRKNKSEVTEEQLGDFYKDKFMDFDDPLKAIHVKTDGIVSYNALMFIPSRPPYNFYTKEYEKGLMLYSGGVLIMEKCADLLPDYFGFVKGLVDSADFSLNISREMLQHDRQLKLVAKNLESKIKSELKKMLDNERDSYVKFFEAFGLPLKFGVYNNFGENKEGLVDLLMFRSSSENKLVTLSEYVARLKEDQKYIYYAQGESIARIERLPQTESLLSKGFEILYMTDDVDEFAVKILNEYGGKPFKSVSAGDLELNDSSEKEESKKLAEENSDLFKAMKDALGDKVSEVRLSGRLVSHPVCLASQGEISLEMEKVLGKIPQGQKVKAARVLEINASHPIFKRLQDVYSSNLETLKTYAEILYAQALLIEGLVVDDPVAFSQAVCGLLIK